MSFFVFNRICILLSRESDQSVITSSLRSCRPSVYHFKIENLVKCLFQQHNKQTCRLVLHTVPLMLNVKQRSGESQLGIKPESTALQANALTTRPSELTCQIQNKTYRFVKQIRLGTSYPRDKNYTQLATIRHKDTQIRRRTTQNRVINQILAKRTPEPSLQEVLPALYNQCRGFTNRLCSLQAKAGGLLTNKKAQHDYGDYLRRSTMKTGYLFRAEPTANLKST